MAYVRKKYVEAAEKAMEAGKKMTPEQKLFTYDGIVYATTLCSPEVFKALESFEARSDDIILDGYCKCGNNWIGQIVTDLVATSAKKHKPHKFNKELLAEIPFLEVGDPEKYQRMKSYLSRRVIYSHLRPDKFPVSVFNNKAKVSPDGDSNPKDVAASFFHFSNTFTAYPPYDTFGAFFEDFMKGQVPWGSYIEFLCMWNKYIDEENIMPITYEEMKENTVLGVEKIAKFLELNLSEKDIQGVAKRSTFRAMKDNSKATHGEFGNAVFRKGSVHDWKTLFSQENNQEMDTVFRERLAGTKVGSLIKYDVYCKA